MIHFLRLSRLTGWYVQQKTSHPHAPVTKVSISLLNLSISRKKLISRSMLLGKSLQFVVAYTKWELICTCTWIILIGVHNSVVNSQFCPQEKGGSRGRGLYRESSKPTPTPPPPSFFILFYLFILRN